VGRYTHWRVVESRRVDGKPRAVPVLQPGTAGALLDRLLRAPQGALRLRSSQHGAVAALKDDEHFALRPQCHWTEQKVRVHAFLCIVAFLLGRVLEREARKLGHEEGLSGLLDLLGTVRLAMVLHPSGAEGGRPRCSWQLEEASPKALRLLRHLVPDKPPFA